MEIVANADLWKLDPNALAFLQEIPQEVRDAWAAIKLPTDDAEGASEVVYRTFSFEIEKSSIDEEKRTAKFVFSSAALDSYDEVVKQDWEKRMARFRANPVVLYNHNKGALFNGPAATLPIGYVTDLKVVGGRLQGAIKFVSAKANPLAELVWNSVIEGSLRATSVGFRPHTIKEEMINDVARTVLSDNELYEVSICPMGANHEAVRLSPGQLQQRQRLLELARSQGKNMETEAQLEGEKAKAAALEAENATIKERAAKLEAELAEAKKVADKAHMKAVAVENAAEAKSFLGKKFGAASIELYVELRSAPELGEKFLQFVKSLPDMALTSSVVADAPVVDVKATGSKLAEATMEILQKALNEEAAPAKA